MVLGVNELGESSAYLYNGLGALVENTWVIKKNAYGYHDVSALTTMVEGEIVVDTATGSKNQKSKLDAEVVAASAELNKTSTVVKQFVVDYTTETFEPLMEYEVNGLDYRYVYGNDRLSVDVKGVTNGAGNIIENGDHIRLYYHMDLRGTVDYLTSPVSKKVVSWTHYNEWGEITHNAVLKCGQRELDLVKRYATHDYDQVLDLYYAKARFYDAVNRRFTAIDPILDGSRYDLREYVKNPVELVQYHYVANNPLIHIDLLGLRVLDMTVESNDPGVIVSYGDKNDKVKQVQEYLKSTGNYIGSIDGSFLAGTAEALESWKRQSQSLLVSKGVKGNDLTNDKVTDTIWTIMFGKNNPQATGTPPTTTGNTPSPQPTYPKDQIPDPSSEDKNWATWIKRKTDGLLNSVWDEIDYLSSQITDESRREDFFRGAFVGMAANVLEGASTNFGMVKMLVLGAVPGQFLKAVDELRDRSESIQSWVLAEANASKYIDSFYYGKVVGDLIAVVLGKLLSYGGEKIGEAGVSLALSSAAVTSTGQVWATAGVIGGQLVTALGADVAATGLLIAAEGMGSAVGDLAKAGYYKKQGCEGDTKSYKKYDPNEIERRYGLKRGDFHREVKPAILEDLSAQNSPYKDLMRKMGNNPDIYLSADGQIQIVSTQFKGKSFVTELNIANFLP